MGHSGAYSKDASRPGSVSGTGKDIFIVWYYTGTAEVIFGAMAIIIILLSLIKLESGKLKRFGWTFFLLALLGYLCLFSYGILGSQFDSKKYFRYRQYLQAVGLALLEYCFSTVNLMLRSLSSILQLKDNKFEYYWFALNVFHLCLSISLVPIQNAYGAGQTLFWNHILNWLFSLLSVCVFIYFYHALLKIVAKERLSKTTADLVNVSLRQFTNYIIFYIFYLICYFFMFLATIGEISNSFNEFYLTCAQIAAVSWGASRFYLLFAAISIFQPWFLRYFTSVNFVHTHDFSERNYLQGTTLHASELDDPKSGDKDESGSADAIVSMGGRLRSSEFDKKGSSITNMNTICPGDTTDPFDPASSPCERSESAHYVV
eukprot:CFRG7912T1